MKFHTLRDCPIADSDFVCRESALLKFIALLVLVVVTAAVWFARGELLWLKIILTATLALFAAFLVPAIRATFDEQNWLVRNGDAGLRVKFRSYLNRKWPAEDVVVVRFDRHEIEFVRAARERFVSRNAEGGDRITWLSYLDLKLRDDVDTSELKRRLAEERDRKPPAGASKWHDAPVRLIEDRIVRIEWSSASRRVTPRLPAAVNRVGSLAPIAPPHQFVTDLRTTPAERRDREDQILQLVERGETLQAIRRARELYGYSLADAKRFVDELGGRRDTVTASD
jgi:hypothetical protein